MHHGLLYDNAASLMAMLAGSLTWLSDDKHVQVVVGLASAFCALTMAARNIVAIYRGKT
jgi:hypothetical protein